MRDHLIEDETRIFRGTGGTVCRVQWFKDPDPFEPWDDCGAVPLVSSGGRGGLDKRPAKGFDLLDPLAHLSDSRIAAKRAEIVEAINAHHEATRRAFGGHYAGNARVRFADAAAWDAECAEFLPDLTRREARREFLALYLSEEIDDASRDLEFVAALWQLAGVPALVTESRGYSQGDFAALLIVAHPEAVKAWGFATRDGRPNWRRYRATCPDDLTRAAELWGAWAWGGGVVGYEVQEIDAEDAPDLDEDPNGPTGEHVDSCWGFYPDKGSDAFNLDDSHAYAVGEAEAAALAHIAERDAERAEDIAAAMYDARPDLAPAELGGLA